MEPESHFPKLGRPSPEAPRPPAFPPENCKQMLRQAIESWRSFRANPCSIRVQRKHEALLEFSRRVAIYQVLFGKAVGCFLNLKQSAFEVAGCTRPIFCEPSIEMLKAKFQLHSAVWNSSKPAGRASGAAGDFAS